MRNASRAGAALSILVLTFCGLLAGARAGPREIVIASYNVENYLGRTPENEGPVPAPRPKAEGAIEAVVAVVKEINPDILGVCEMGRPEQFEDFKKRLAEAGLGFTDFEYVQGADADRHLALLSRLPITARHSQPDAAYDLNGVPQKVKRGFLDVTVQATPAYELRLVGAHLKSKRPGLESEELMRRHEALLLRQHAEQILTAAPQTNLLVYGDFNDLKSEPSIQSIMGPRGSSQHLADLALHDSVGDRWTHYWKTTDVYSRFDYFFVSPALTREIVAAHSGISRSELWNKASDHRAIYAAVWPVDRR